jgi:hypothetical protein
LDKNIINNAAEEIFGFLTDIGYFVERYDLGPEFGLNYLSKEKNRSIQIDFPAYENGEINIGFKRKFTKLFPLFIKDTDRRISFNLKMIYKNDPDYNSIPKEIWSEDYKTTLNLYANFLKTKMGNIISGEKWVC